MRCYFHLVSEDETISDDSGIEVSDLAEAQKMALHAIEEMRDEALEHGSSWQGWRIDIVDPSGQILVSIPLDPTVH